MEGALGAESLAEDLAGSLDTLLGACLNWLLHECIDVDGSSQAVNGLSRLEQVLSELVLIGGRGLAVSGEAHAAAFFGLLASGFSLTLAGLVVGLGGLAGRLQGLEGLLVLLSLDEQVPVGAGEVHEIDVAYGIIEGAR